MTASRIYGIIATAFLLYANAGIVRASDAPVIVPYEVDRLSPVTLHVLQPICRPEGLSYPEGIGDPFKMTVSFYVLFHNRGIHRQVILCTNGDKRQEIAIEYVPGQIDDTKVPVANSGVSPPKECAGLLLPDVRMLAPQNGETMRFRERAGNGTLYYAVSDPQSALQLDVQFVNGKNAIAGRGTFFEIYGLPKMQPGYVAHNARSEVPLAAGTTYHVEVAFKPSWATPGICTAPFTLGEFTLAPYVPSHRVPGCTAGGLARRELRRSADPNL